MSSNLEKAPDKILFKILKEVTEGYTSFFKFKRDLHDYSQKIMEMATPFGTKEKMMDVDYILSLAELNFGMIINFDTLQENLKRPKLGKYEVEYKVNLTEYKTQWYTMKVNSYSSTSSKEIMEMDYNEGDFYWFEEIQTPSEMIKFVAVADCTGHGVPGAFMSMIGNQLLHEIIIKNQVYSPDLILNNLHKEVHRVLRQKETNTNDGMDMVILAIIAPPCPPHRANLVGVLQTIIILVSLHHSQASKHQTLAPCQNFIVSLSFAPS